MTTKYSLKKVKARLINGDETIFKRRGSKGGNVGYVAICVLGDVANLIHDPNKGSPKMTEAPPKKRRFR